MISSPALLHIRYRPRKCLLGNFINTTVELLSLATLRSTQIMLQWAYLRDSSNNNSIVYRSHFRMI